MALYNPSATKEEIISIPCKFSLNYDIYNLENEEKIEAVKICSKNLHNCFYYFKLKLLGYETTYLRISAHASEIYK